MLENQKANLVLDHRLLRVWFYALIYLSTYLSKVKFQTVHCAWSAMGNVFSKWKIFIVLINCLKNGEKKFGYLSSNLEIIHHFSLFCSCFFSPSPSTWKGTRNWTRATKRATECFLSWCKLLFVCCLCCCGVYCICSALAWI